MKKKILLNIISLIVLIVMIMLTLTILSLNVLPSKYLMLFIGAEIIFYLVALVFYNLKHWVFITLGVLFYIISVSGNLFGYYYLSKTNKYLEENFAVDSYEITTKYVVVANINDSANNIKEIKKENKINYYKYGRSISKALKTLGNYNYVETDKGIDALNDVTTNNNYFLVAKASYDYLLESTNLIVKDNYKIIYEFDVLEKVKKNTNVPDSYNIYINGLDYTGIMRDYNLIATINTKTRKVVLTSIPRDFYIDVPAYNMKDTLMCMGSLDAEVSKEALEKLFNTKIDYTINFNTNSLVSIVDTIGGVEFCSKYDFYTTHDLNLGSYSDKGEKLHVTKECRTYNGLETLAIARQRMGLPGRDRARQENCRQILINIVKKLASTTTLKNYDNVLKSFDGLYTTDMNKTVISNLIKIGIDDMNFDIIEQSVDGVDGIGIGHLGTQESWIMTPDMNIVNNASKKINEVLKEKK
ncbi:MAG: hypothetical protein HFJ11_05900 [Bacilli bacterium]|nr:hypothetical protein [Bacilli bacterium]